MGADASSPLSSLSSSSSLPSSNTSLIVAAAAAATTTAAAGAALAYYSYRGSGRNRYIYPSAARTDSTVERHGVAVPDCYAWLEDPSSAQTRRWIGQQQTLTNAYLDNAGAAGGPRDRERMVELMKGMKDYVRAGCPFFVHDDSNEEGQRAGEDHSHAEQEESGTYYFFKNDGLQNQSVLYQCDRGASWKSVQSFINARASGVPIGGEAEEAEEASSPPRAFLDMNASSEEGTVALRTLAFSEDGKLCAYGVSSSGSDWMSIFVRRCHGDREDLADTVRWAKFSGISWTHDSAGFFYSAMPKPASLDADADASGASTTGEDAAGTEVDLNTGHSVYYHRLGTDYRKDVLVHRDEDNPNHLHGCGVSECGKYAVLSTSSSCDPTNMVAIARIDGWDGMTPLSFHPLVPDFRASFHYIHNENRTFYFKTNLDAPRNKIVKIDLPNLPPPVACSRDGEPVHGRGTTPQWLRGQLENSVRRMRTILHQHPTDVLEGVDVAAGDRLIVTMLSDVKSKMFVHELRNGRLAHQVPMPGHGSVSSLTCDRKRNDFFFHFNSYTDPGSIFHVDISNKRQQPEVSVYFETVVPGYDKSLFESKQVFYESKDGTRIPMVLIGRKGEVGREADEGEAEETSAGPGPHPRPTILYGYGGFSISLTPSFAISRLLWVTKFGGTYAIANIRGGGEYGEDWHKAGTKSLKQTCFDDFTAAAEYLIDRGITSRSKLCINGGSNGGLLVAAVMLQRPELFGAVIADVGVLDMLKFHKFTIGHAWTSDYGCSEGEDYEQFATIYRYSPLHNIPSLKTLPALLLCTADHDDRVVPAHSFKFAAAVQATVGVLPQQTKPLLIRIESKAGHGAGKPVSKQLEEAADKYVFAATELGATFNG